MVSDVEEEVEEIRITHRKHKDSNKEKDHSPPGGDKGRAPSKAPSRAASRHSHHSKHSRPGSPGGSSGYESDKFKRLIVCCDGTWVDSESDLEHGTIAPPSNVTRLSRAIRTSSSDGIEQIVYYQEGVGSIGSPLAKAVQGATGAGLGNHVREAFAFLSYNYEEGDEIFLIGFSRGAYTARSVGGLIGDLGVMTKEGMWSFPVVWKDYLHRHDRDYRTPNRDVPFPNKPPFRDPEYVREMERRGMTRTKGVRIRAIAVFDTVGALGIPKPTWLGKLSTKSIQDTNEYAFWDTTLSNCVDHAFQALALDERRGQFQPALWEKRGNTETKLIQCWFPGNHACIGGGWPDQELANISLAWMMSMLAPLLDLKSEYILEQERENAKYYKQNGEQPRPWSLGKIPNSAVGVFALGGQITRTPGEYKRMDPKNGQYTNRPLRDTNEYIHASVRSRIVLEGPGVDDKGIYRPKALKHYRLRGGRGIQGLPSPWYWEDNGNGNAILPEAPLRKIEKMLLATSPDVEDYVLEPPAPPRRKGR